MPTVSRRTISPVQPASKHRSKLTVPTPEKGATMADRLLDCVRSGDVEALRLLIQEGADLTIRDSEGGTLLHMAVWAGKPEICEFLIAAGVDPNAEESMGWTPLHTAAIINRLSCVEPLVRGGANIDMQDVQGWAALHYAANSGFQEVCRELLELGADDSLRGHNGKTPVECLKEGDSAATREVFERCRLARTVHHDDSEPEDMEQCEGEREPVV